MAARNWAAVRVVTGATDRVARHAVEAVEAVALNEGLAPHVFTRLTLARSPSPCLRYQYRAIRSHLKRPVLF